MNSEPTAITPYDDFLRGGLRQQGISKAAKGLSPFAPKPTPERKSEYQQRYRAFPNEIVYIPRPLSWLIGCPIFGVAFTTKQRAIELTYATTINPLALPWDGISEWFTIFYDKTTTSFSRTDSEALAPIIFREYRRKVAEYEAYLENDPGEIEARRIKAEADAGRAAVYAERAAARKEARINERRKSEELEDA